MAVQERLLSRFHGAIAASSSKVLQHQGKGLHRPLLPAPQFFHRCFVRSIAAQVEPPYALDGYDMALCNKAPGLGNRCRPPLRPIQNIDLRATVVAAHGLGIVAPGSRVHVFPIALRTHGKVLHSGPFPVVGHGLQDGQPGPAGGTVDKGMQVPAIHPIKELPFAVVANGDVRGHEDLTLLPGTFHNLKVRESRPVLLPYNGLQNDGTGWRFLHKGLAESLPLLPLYHHFYIGAFIAHRSCKAKAGRQAADERTEAHALDDAEDVHQGCLHTIASRIRHSGENPPGCR